MGCANGHLMECVERWARRRGFAIEAHGLDIAPELAALARTRLPRWAERIHVGDVSTWAPDRRFDFVRTGLEYVPERRRRELVERLLGAVVAPGGRLVIGTVNEERSEERAHPWQEDLVAGWGFRIAGHSERPHFKDARLLYRVFWIDAPSS